MKDSITYEDASEIKAGVYLEVAAKKKKKDNAQDVENATKKEEDCNAFKTESRRCHGLHHLRTIVSQRHTYNKGETMAQRK